MQPLKAHEMNSDRFFDSKCDYWDILTTAEHSNQPMLEFWPWKNKDFTYDDQAQITKIITYIFDVVPFSDLSD